MFCGSFGIKASQHSHHHPIFPGTSMKSEGSLDSIPQYGHSINKATFHAFIFPPHERISTDPTDFLRIV